MTDSVPAGICACGREVVWPQRTRCRECADRDPHRNASRTPPTMGVSVDCEGREIDGVMRLVTASYGREDGTSASLTAAPGGWLNGLDILAWLVGELSGHYTDAEGAEWRQAAMAFHFNFDSSVLARDFPEVGAYLIHKAVSRGERDPLCWSSHRYDAEADCRKIHRSDPRAIALIIGEGGENGLLAFDPASCLAIAATPKRRLYVEYRPNGDRFEGNRRLDIHDTGTAFAGGLEKVVDEWQPELSPEQRDIIAWGKAARKRAFAGALPGQIEAYSEAECVSHARTVRLLVDAIRDATHIVISPAKVFGAGSLASAVFRHHQAPKRDETHTDTRRVAGIAIDDIPKLTYFGGMIETPVIGCLDEVVDEVDLNSAYPSRMVSFPCMRDGHGHWATRRGDDLRSIPANAVGHVLATWSVDTPSTPPFMVRTKDTLVRQPLVGADVWVTLDEFRAAGEQFGDGVWAARIVWWVPECECPPPFVWAAELYHVRQGIKAEMGTLARLSGLRPDRGERGSDEWRRLNCQQNAIKLVLNSCYGKLAQRRHGGGPYSNLHYASAITGATRARVRVETWAREAQGGTVVYQHTDSVRSVGGAPVDGGKGLGSWGLEAQAEALMIVQPGLAVDLSGKGKSAMRGFDDRKADEADEEGAVTKSFRAFVAESDLTEHPTLWPELKLPTTRMTSRRMAIARGRPSTAGLFVHDTMTLVFATMKRRFLDAYPVPGNPRAWAVPPLPFVAPTELATLADVEVKASAIDILFTDYTLAGVEAETPEEVDADENTGTLDDADMFGE